MKRLKNESGSALLVALAVLSLITMLSLATTRSSMDDLQVSFNDLNKDQAFYIAEAGYKSAYQMRKNDSTWNAGFDGVEFSGGTYSVQLVDSLTVPALKDTVLLMANGSKDNAQVNLLVTLAPPAGTPFGFAMFGDLGIEISSSCSDSYNSDSGTYAATVINSGGNIGSNGTVSITAGSNIAGDVSTALANGLTISGSTVLGDTTTAAPSQTLNAVPDSEFIWAQGVSNAPWGLSGNYTYDPVTKALRFKDLVLASGVYFFSSIYADTLSNLILAPGANVTIYVSGDVEFEHQSTVNANNNPATMTIFSQGAEFEIEDSSTFFGTFYGPNSEAEIEHDSQLYGSIVANEMEMEDNSCFHYDRNLANYKKGKGTGLVVVAWREQ